MRLAVLALLLIGCKQDYKLDAAPRQVEVTPSILDFGHVGIGADVPLDVLVTSVSGGDVQVVAADLLDSSGSWFSVDPGLPTVPQDGTGSITVRYTPGEEGWHTALLTILTDEEVDNAHIVDLRGHASPSSVQVWPSLLDFGPVRPGESVSRDVTVFNDGGLDVSLSSATTDQPWFTTSPGLPTSIAVGASFVLSVEFTANDGREVVDTLNLGLDSGGEASVELRANNCATGDPALYDVDGDGWSACADDCDDADPDSHPGGLELCDGVDSDCDGTVDEGTACYDDDGDGFTEQDDDCNDGDAAVSPAAQEDLRNGIDDDCDGVIDLGTEDLDGDGYVEDSGDCSVLDPLTYPGAPELEDSIDNDCDGVVDDNTLAFDDDRDGFTEYAGDCDDTDLAVNPGANESADWVDNDCDGQVDEGTSYADDDGDGFTEQGGDCDDADAAANPGAQELLGNRIDDNCDGTVE